MTINWEKYIALGWTVRMTTPDGKQIENKTASDFEAAISIASGMCTALKIIYGLDIGWKFAEYNEGRRYFDLNSDAEYIHITCNEGADQPLKPGSQMRIETYVGYSCAGYQWGWQIKKVGVRVVDHETIYRDFWITGGYFYMTNDTKKDSLDLGSVNPNTIIEFVELSPAEAAL